MKQAVLVALTLMLASGAAAQDGPDVEEDGTEDAAPERWRFESNLSLTSTSGNDQITVFVTDGKITHLQTDVMQLDLTGRIRYGRSGGEEVAQNMQTALTVELGPAAPVSPFVFGSAEKDPFKRLDLRTSSGAGVRYHFVRREWAELTVSGAALHSYENLEILTGDLPTTERTHNARWRWVARGKASLMDEDIVASHETFYEPVWDHASDYLMEVESTVRFRINDHLAFRVAHVFQRDSSPPEDVRQNDNMLTVGVGFTTKF